MEFAICVLALSYQPLPLLAGWMKYGTHLCVVSQHEASLIDWLILSLWVCEEGTVNFHLAVVMFSVVKSNGVFWMPSKLPVSRKTDSGHVTRVPPRLCTKWQTDEREQEVEEAMRGFGIRGGGCRSAGPS